MARKTSLRESVPGIMRVLRFFWPWTAKHRGLVASSLGALLVGVALRLAEPWPLKFILDLVVPTRKQRGLRSFPQLEELDAATLLTLSCVALIVITGLRALADYHRKVGFAQIGNRVLREVRDHVYRRMQSLSLAFHNQARAGDMIIRVTRDVSLLRDVISTAVLPLLANILILVAMAAIMLWMQWQLALLAMATVPLFWVSTIKIGRKIQEAARKQRKREGAMASTASESITAMKVVKALSLEEEFAESFSSRNRKSQKEEMKAARLSAGLGRTVDVLLAVATALVMWWGGRLVMAGSLSAGDLVVFLAYLKRAFNPAKDFAKYTARMAKAAAAGERVLEILQRAPEIQDLPDADEAPPFEGHVRFENVRFSYEPGHPILDGFSCDVPARTLVSLVGPSGIGKSTVTSLLLRLYDPEEGRILIDGRDIRSHKLASVRRQINVVLQDTILFGGTIQENIACVVPGATREDVERAARLARADEFIRKLPAGYETRVGERGVMLSHGQRQRIAVARAAIRPAPILILDEPTTGLDEENQNKVVQALLELASGRTTFLVTHDLTLAASADLILYLEDGVVAESGSPAELLAAGGRFARLYHLQTREGAQP